jgi:hypothetical protein
MVEVFFECRVSEAFPFLIPYKSRTLEAQAGTSGNQADHIHRSSSATVGSVIQEVADSPTATKEQKLRDRMALGTTSE